MHKALSVRCSLLFLLQPYTTSAIRLLRRRLTDNDTQRSILFLYFYISYAYRFKCNAHVHTSILFLTGLTDIDTFMMDYDAKPPCVNEYCSNMMPDVSATSDAYTQVHVNDSFYSQACVNQNCGSGDEASALVKAKTKSGLSCRPYLTHALLTDFHDGAWCQCP